MMIQTKTYEFKGKIYSEIPDEVAEKLQLRAGDELNFDISDKIVITTVKGNNLLSAEEKVTLAQLNNIMHKERTAMRVETEFDEKIINKMIEKGILFRYDDGKMIGVDRKFADFKLASGILGELDIYGFLIIEGPRIMELTNALENAKRIADVTGVRSFDKKFYVILRSKFQKYKNAVLEEITKPKTLTEISKNLRINDALVKTILEILKEQGEVIERQKDTFQAV